MKKHRTKKEKKRAGNAAQVIETSRQAPGKAVNELDIALQALGKIDVLGQDSETALAEVFKTESVSQGSRSRKLIHDLVMEILRWRGRLDFFISRCPETAKIGENEALLNYSRLIFYFRFLSTTLSSAGRESVVSAIVEQAPDDLKPALDGLKSAIIDNYFHVDFPNHEKEPLDFISSYFSYPSWLVKLLVEEFGQEDALAFCERCNVPRSTTVQINPRLSTRRNIRRTLQEGGRHTSATNYSPYGLHIYDIDDIESLDSFRNGEILPSDESDQLGAILGASASPFCIIDTGRKSVARALLMASLLEEGEILVPNLKDINHSDGILTQRWFDTNVRISSPDLTSVSNNLHADVVLVEAAGSATGHICLKPEIKWQLSPDAIESRKKDALNELERWASLVADNGILIYLTASVLKSENQKIVQEFILKHPDYKLCSAREHLPPSCHKMVDESGYMTAFPHQFEMEGAFAAILSKGECQE